MFVHTAESLKISFQLRLHWQFVLVHAGSDPASSLTPALSLLLSDTTGSAFSPAAVFSPIPFAGTRWGMFNPAAYWLWSKSYSPSAADESCTAWGWQPDSHINSPSESSASLLSPLRAVGEAWKRFLLPHVNNHRAFWARLRKSPCESRRKANGAECCIFLGITDFLSPSLSPYPHILQYPEAPSKLSMGQVPCLSSYPATEMQTLVTPCPPAALVYKVATPAALPLWSQQEVRRGVMEALWTMQPFPMVTAMHVPPLITKEREESTDPDLFTAGPPRCAPGAVVRSSRWLLLPICQQHLSPKPHTALQTQSGPCDPGNCIVRTPVKCQSHIWLSSVDLHWTSPKRSKTSGEKITGPQNNRECKWEQAREAKVQQDGGEQVDGANSHRAQMVHQRHGGTEGTALPVVGAAPLGRRQLALPARSSAAGVLLFPCPRAGWTWGSSLPARWHNCTSFLTHCLLSLARSGPHCQPESSQCSLQLLSPVQLHKLT